MGILGYFFYQYLMYAVFWAFGPLFVLFVVIYAASAVAIVWIISTIDIASLPARVDATRFPRKTLAVVCSVMALQLVGMWAARIAAGFERAPTLAVQAMDLGIVVPLAIATAVLVWTRRPWGYLLGPVFAVKGVTMAGAICAMLISSAFVEGSIETGSLAIFGTAAALFGMLAYKTLMSIEPNRAQATVTAGMVTATRA